MSAVYNIKDRTAPEDGVFIGRPTKWGNPFRMDGVSREEVLARYRLWLLSNPALVADAKRELKGKNLLCYCKPRACHGDILFAVANEDDSL